MSISEHTIIIISVVTPVYNGEPFIQQAYDSLRRQSFACWEWVVVDDGSTDGTLALLRQIAGSDPRVRCYTQPASGSAKQPRDHAVAEARGMFVLPLDIDDRLSDDYLEKMLIRQKNTEADIVYPHMVFVDMATGKTTEELPAAGFDASRVYGGRDLVKETMPEWRIGCNGGLYRPKVWVNRSWPVKEKPVWMNSDEVDERLYLLQARRVAFADAHYFYQNHAASISTRVSPKLFHTLKTSLELFSLIEDEFGKESEEYQRMLRKAFCDWRWKMATYVQHHDELAFADAQIHQNLAACFARLSASVLTPGERLQFLWLKSFPLLLALFCMKYKPRLLWQKIIARLWPQEYASLFVRRQVEKQFREQLERSYHADAAPLKPEDAVAVCMNCGNTESGGLVDRLRGAVSVFEVCQQAGRPFRLFFTHPFRLEDYLEPAAYDWRCAEPCVSFSAQHVERVVLQVVSGLEGKRHQQQMHSALRQNPDKQVHFYTNANFCYDDGDFAASFNTLFRPTPRLQGHLERIRHDIGTDDYISVSARFCNLLDDFNEEVYSEPLSIVEREKLLSGCMDQLGQLLKGVGNGQRVLLCSDSTTFLQRAQQTFPGAFYVIPGTVSHIGNDGVHSYEYYEKTFLDFFTIARASRVCLLLGPGMMRSGFPYAAARSQGKPFDILAFRV